MKTGDEGCARGAAAGAGVEGGEFGASGGESVEVGRGNFASVAGKIGETEIIGEDQEDVWFYQCRKNCGDRSENDDAKKLTDHENRGLRKD